MQFCRVDTLTRIGRAQLPLPEAQMYWVIKIWLLPNVNGKHLNNVSPHITFLFNSKIFRIFFRKDLHFTEHLRTRKNFRILRNFGTSGNPANATMIQFCPCHKDHFDYFLTEHNVRLQQAAAKPNHTWWKTDAAVLRTRTLASQHKDRKLGASSPTKAFGETNVTISCLRQCKQTCMTEHEAKWNKM